MTTSDREATSVDLWIAQWALALAFHALGLLKAFVSATDLQQALHLVTQAPSAVLRPVGLVELVGSLGLILPAATGVLPRLTPIAAGCLAGVAALGAVMPETAGGMGLPLPNVLLMVGCAWVAWGRVALAPITPLGLREASRVDEEQHRAYLDGSRRARPRSAPGETGRGAVA